jgi:hypothetical protein
MQDNKPILGIALLKLNFPTFIIFVLITILAYGERYNEILASIVFAGFVSIVVNSKRYPKINDFFEKVF